MRVLLIALCMAWAVMAAPTVSDDVTQDPFIALIKEMENQPFFRLLSDTHRLLTFEILTAAETYNLGPLLDSLGYVELLKYLDALTKDFSHQFIGYSIQGRPVYISSLRNRADEDEATLSKYSPKTGTRAVVPGLLVTPSLPVISPVPHHYR